MKKLLKVAAALLLAAVTFTACNSDSDTNYTALLLAKNSSNTTVDYTQNFIRGFWKYTIEANGKSETKYLFYTEAKDSDKRAKLSSYTEGQIYPEGLVLIGNSTQYWNIAATTIEKEYVTTVRNQEAFTWETLYKNSLNGINKFEKVTKKSELPSWCTVNHDDSDGVHLCYIHDIVKEDENFKNTSSIDWYGW